MSTLATAQTKHLITVDTKLGEAIGFWKGCRPSGSPGCNVCYSIVLQMPGYGYKHPTQVTKNKDYDKPRRFKKPSMVFVNPWSDFFIDDPVANVNRDEAWSVVSHNYFASCIVERILFLSSGNFLWKAWMGVSRFSQSRLM